MINTFIAAIVALFFWGKSSKDLEEKTQLASWLRTCVYGVLTFMVLVFYVKTYQVATVFHTVQVKGIKETVNANGELADSIAVIELTNKFSSNITENYFLNKAVFSEGAEKIRRISEKGGLFLALNLHNGPAYKLRTNPQFEELKNEIKKMNGYVPEATIGDYPLDAYSHAYWMNYMTSSIPSLIPFFPTLKMKKKFGLNNGIYEELIMGDCDSFGEGLTSTAIFREAGGITHKVASPDFLHEMYVGNGIICDTLTNLEDYHYKFNFANDFIQRMNFFTAADVSQYICDVILETDCYIEKMELRYDIPVEITPHDSCIITSQSYVLKGDFLNKYIANKGNYSFHVKFPTLANLQLIRSLILTTLLTALVSLFFCNLFYLFRKYVIRFKEKHISEISVEKAKIFRRNIYFLTYAIMAFIVYVTLRIYNEHPFHIDIKILSWLYHYLVWVILAILALLCILLYLFFRKAYIKKNK